MMRIPGVLALLTVAVVTGRPLSSPARGESVFRDVSIVDVETGVIRAGQSVVVSDGRIAWVGPTASLQAPAGAAVVDGQGRFLLPGLADMHVHVSPSDFPMLIASGVTTVREMNGSENHLRWRDWIASGDSLGPTLLVASPLMAGTAQRYRHVLIASPERGASEVRRAAVAGYDFVKAYDGLSLEAYQALVAEARARGKPVVGHVPASVGLDTLLASGQRSIEHVDQILARVTSHPPDTAAIAPAVARIARHPETWVTPTLAVEKFLTMPLSPWSDSLFAQPYLSYQDTATLGWWLSVRRGPVPDAARRARQEAYFEWKRRFVRELHRAGVKLLVGTDTPNPGMVPGFSLLEELEVLTEAGMSRAEVLRAATRGAAEFMGAAGEFGTIQVAARADLVLVTGNPLADLQVLRHPDGVMIRGRWLDRAALALLLSRAR